MPWADFYITALMHFSHVVQAGLQHEETENIPQETVSKRSTMLWAECDRKSLVWPQLDEENTVTGCGCAG